MQNVIWSYAQRFKGSMWLQARALAGEDVPEEEEEPAEAPKAAKRGGAAKTPTRVAVSLRCDEAFGMVLVELTVQ